MDGPAEVENVGSIATLLATMRRELRDVVVDLNRTKTKVATLERETEITKGVVSQKIVLGDAFRREIHDLTETVKSLTINTLLARHPPASARVSITSPELVGDIHEAGDMGSARSHSPRVVPVPEDVYITPLMMNQNAAESAEPTKITPQAFDDDGGDQGARSVQICIIRLAYLHIPVILMLHNYLNHA